MSKCPNEGGGSGKKPVRQRQLLQDDEAPFGEEEYPHIKGVRGSWFFPYVLSLNYLPLDRDIQNAMRWSEM